MDAARVYYVNQPENGLGRINAVNPDGTSHSTIYTTATITDLRGITVDPVGRRLYYVHTDLDPGTQVRTAVSIRSLSISGGLPTSLASFPDGTFLADVEWDEVNSRVYFAKTGDLQLWRMAPDGSELTRALTHTGAGQGPYFFGLDLRNSLAYWGVSTQPGETSTAFSRGSLATGVVDASFSLITPSRTRDVAIDTTVPGGHIYWCDRQDGRVYNRAPGGGPVLTSRSGLNAPHGLVLDVEAGKGYVADTGKRGSGLQPSAHRVVRFNLDGSGGLEFLSPVDSLAEPWDLAVDLTSGSYNGWKTRFFSAGAALATQNDDPDGDGFSNFSEYAFFTHPERPDASRALIRAEGRTIRFARRLSSDISYRVEVSLDLETWHWNGDSAGTVWTTQFGTEPRDADSQWIIVGLAGPWADETKAFFRLRALPSPLATALSDAPSLQTTAVKPQQRTVRRARVGR